MVQELLTVPQGRAVAKRVKTYWDRDEHIEKAWEEFLKNLPRRKSIKLAKMFANGEEQKRNIEDFYYALRFVDDGVDLVAGGKGERLAFLNHMESLFKGRGRAGGKRIPSEEVLKNRDTEGLIDNFVNSYGEYDGLLKNIFEGFRIDIEKEGKTFSRKELEIYEDLINTLPTVVGLKAAGIDIPWEHEYTKEGLRAGSQATMKVKQTLGKEIREDSEMNQLYISKEALESAGFDSRYDFLIAVFTNPEDARLGDIVRNRLYEASKYFQSTHRHLSLLLKAMELKKESPERIKDITAVRQFIAGYALVAKEWTKKFVENGFAPLQNSPEAYKMWKETGEKEYLKQIVNDVDPSTLGYLKIFLKVKTLMKPSSKDGWLCRKAEKSAFDWGMGKLGLEKGSVEYFQVFSDDWLRYNASEEKHNWLNTVD